MRDRREGDIHRTGIFSCGYVSCIRFEVYGSARLKSAILDYSRPCRLPTSGFAPRLRIGSRRGPLPSAGRSHHDPPLAALCPPPVALTTTPCPPSAARRRRARPRARRRRARPRARRRHTAQSSRPRPLVPCCIARRRGHLREKPSRDLARSRSEVSASCWATSLGTVEASASVRTTRWPAAAIARLLGPRSCDRGARRRAVGQRLHLGRLGDQE